MTPREFFDKVAQMRQYQKEYFKTRSGMALQKSKTLEREIDTEIERVNNIVKSREQPQQANLFK